MKTKFLSLLVSGLVGFSLNVVADDNHESDQNGDQQCEHQGDDEGDNQQSGNIEGSETLVAKIILTATNNAPAGATGCAKLVSDNENGTVTATLSIKTKGLDAGDYTLSIVRKSDGSSVTLGTISIGTSNGGDDEGEGDEGEGDCHNQDTNSPPSVILVSESEIALPADLDPTDIAQIVISDANGKPGQGGDRRHPAPGASVKFSGRIHVKGGSSAKDKALMKSVAQHGKSTVHFTMIASGVPASSTLHVHVNGAHVGTVNSNKKGKVMVKKLPASLSAIRSVRLVDAQGRTAASANF